MAVPVKTFAPTLGDVVKFEHDISYTREVATLTGAVFPVGTILGKVTVDTVAANTTVAAGVNLVSGAANTGNGVLTKDPTTPALPDAKPGVYVAVVTDVTPAVATTPAVAASSVFTVYDPSGRVVGQADTGGTFAREIKFSVTQGGTAWAIGDSINITVPPGSGKYTTLKLGPLGNGTHLPAGIVLFGADATSVDQKVAILARGPAIVSSACLVWDATITTDNQKAQKLAALLALGIVVRQAA